MSLVDTSMCARRGGFKLAVHHFIFLCVWQKWIRKEGEHLNHKYDPGGHISSYPRRESYVPCHVYR